MESSILKQIARFLQEQKKQKRWLVVFLCLAIIVGFGTVTALKMRGQAMTHKEKRVICQLAVHQHADECYDENKENLICGYADYVVHVHNEDCYDWNGNLTCQLPEVEKHEHSEECYTEEATLICGLEETAGHQHGAECYTTQQGGMVCQVPEHTHAAECYDETGAVICGLEEHIHEDACYEWTDVLICQLAEGADGHTHTEACYEVKEILSCGKLELHTHTDECYEKINEEEELSETNRRLVCTVPVLEEHIHTEDAGCLETVEVTANGELVEEGTVEEETAEGETEEEIFTTDLDGEDAEAEDEEAEAEEEDAEEADIEEKTYEETKTYKGDGYVVTVSYNKDANIPEEAELIAEQITEENDEETFSKHAAEFQKAMEDKNNTMELLFKIGFYIEGKEIEPERPVLVTIQFLDENGLPESSPVTVVHFGDEENEILDGSEVENGSTSFETRSFSYFGMRARQKKTVEKQEAEVHVSDSFEYKNDMFHVNFRIEGNAVLLEKEDDDTEHLDEDYSSKGKENTENVDEEEAVVEDSNEEIGGEVSEEDEDIELEESANEDESGSDEDFEAEVGTDVETEDSGKTDSELIQGTDPEFQFYVDTLDEKTKEYELINKYAKKKGESGELLQMQVLSYSLKYGDRELDLSDCDVIAEIIPGEKLTAHVEKIVNNENDQRSVTLAAYELKEDKVSEVEDKFVTNATISEPMNISLNSSTIAMASNIVDDPEFTVQYYAYMKVVKTEESKTDNSIELIDTSASGNGRETAVMPVNNNLNLKTLNIKVEDSGEPGDIIIDSANGIRSNKWDISYESKLMEIYSERDFKMMQYPELVNVNKFAVQDPHYQLKEVWEWKGEENAAGTDSIEPEGWCIYKDLEKLKFTNNPDIKENDPNNTILMEENTIIRLVAESSLGSHNNDAAFYDYDITDGEVYSDEKLTTLGKRDSTEILYANINQQGINNPSNYGNKTEPRYGFGNINTAGTGIDEDRFNGNLINKANGNSFGSCSFGLVGNQLNKRDSVVYPQFNVNAPKLFSSGEETPLGETAVSGYSLDFNRDGDTYTLTAVNGSNTADELERFQHRMNWNKTRKLWTNNFWPMDSSAETYGTDGHDLFFGESSKKDKRKAVGSKQSESFPEGDDGKDHNSYFGINFAVDFELTDDYVGPLNYYFFGDDDMWVFLCPIDENNNMNVEESRLICDIGGVHSSVGEYVDLRDYLPEGTTGKYSLVFFYTERGASGSTCWMQFTLPSVNTRPITQDTGTLKNTLTVSKTVDGPVPDGQEFEFEIEFKDENGIDRYNCYAYKIVETESNPEIEVKSGTIKTGDSFFLGKGQSIIVRNLPDKTTYTIREKDYNGYRPEITGTGTVEGGETNGEIDWDDDYYQEISYVNVYDYELPETGGSGSIIYTMAGVLAILSGAGFMYRKKVRERRV